jgi:ABC-type multidrug transport system ATPase subunit
LIALEGLGKTYRSPLRRRAVAALDGVTLAVPDGEVLGIAGPNGAGKSTLISLLLGFLDPTAGRATIDGQAPRAWVRRRGAGYLPELIALPGRWRAADALARAAVLSGVPPGDRARRVASCIERLGLAEHAGKQVRQLSKGTLQRLGLAQALLADHALVILDEPTHGLDPLWTQRFRDVVREERRPGRVIVVASHNLDELERVADRVAILHRGRLERVAAPGTGPMGGWYRLRLAAPHPALAAAFPAAESVGASGAEVRIHGEPAALSAGLRALLEAGAVVEAWYPERSRLEAAFREAVGEQ